MKHCFGLVLAALLLAPFAASGAGLGRLTVHSIVGEPLDAEVEVVSVLPDEAESLAASLAPAEAYERARIGAVPNVEAVRTAVERKSDGGYVVKLTSTEPVGQPLVNLLIVLSWSGGSTGRQYSFLLDSVDRRPARAAARRPTVPAEREATPPRRDPERPADVVARASSPLAARTEYTVQPSDTLYKVARATRYEGVTLAQMIVAIYRANEDAFVDSNMNQLKAGGTLKIPDRKVVAAVTEEDARQFLATTRAPSGETRSKSEGTPPSAGPRGDDAAARDRALAESRDRATALEQTLSGLRQLIEARDRELTDLQRQLGGKAPSAGTNQPAVKVNP